MSNLKVDVLKEVKMELLLRGIKTSLFLLKSEPNEYMMPYQFFYKVVSLLLLNDNAFVYPFYDRDTLELKALKPLNPIIV